MCPAKALIVNANINVLKEVYAIKPSQNKSYISYKVLSSFWFFFCTENIIKGSHKRRNKALIKIKLQVSLRLAMPRF